MTTITPRAEARARRRAAFTLAEVLVASAMSLLILGAVLSTFLVIGRTGYQAAAYTDMAGSLRVALDRFTRDVRLAQDLRWQDERRVILLLPAPGGTREVAYGYATVTMSPRASGVFYRETTPASGGAPVREELVCDIDPGFSFRRYRLAPAGAEDAPAANDLETKLLEVTLRSVRHNVAGRAVSQAATSTRAVLRNKSSGA